MSPTNAFTVHVVFTGLVLFVRKEGVVTHALLRDGPDRDEDGGGPAHDRHYPYLAWANGCKRLDRVRLQLEWLRLDGTPVPLPLGATRVGPEEVGKLPTFWGQDKDDQSFEWVPHFGRMGPPNRVRSNCLADSNVSPYVAAQLLLHGGCIRTGRFAWGEEQGADGTTEKSADREGVPQHRVKKWIPAFLYRVQDVDPGPPSRAAAELVVWDVPAHPQAHRLRISCEDLDSRDTPEPCGGLPAEIPITHGGELWLTVSNSPAPMYPPSGTAHPARVANAPAKHFDMLYDLLSDDVPSRFQWMPNLPGDFRPGHNVMDDVEPALPFYECGELYESQLAEELVEPEGYVHRPICIPASADASED